MAAMQAPTDNNPSSSQSTAAAAPVRVWGLTPLAWWRGFAIFFLILLIFAAATGMSMFEQFKAQVAHLQKQLLVLPQIKYIAVLTDGQGAPALLVTLDPTENSLVLQRLGSIKEGREDSLQLWALPASGAPRSLGLLASGSKTLRIPATEKDLREVPQLGVSVESKGGVEDSHGPSGPLLLKGAVVQKAL
jgi:anti-sigma-K factor RskA